MLAQFMMDHDIAVATRHTYVVKTLDGDFFAEDEV